MANSELHVAAGWVAAAARARAWAPDGAGSAVVVVPHPDDESVMFGGLLAGLTRRGAPVTVVAVTDGEAAYPQEIEPAALRSLRVLEHRAALERLGLRPESTVRLGLPDGGVARHEEDLVAALCDVIDDTVQLVVAHGPTTITPITRAAVGRRDGRWTAPGQEATIAEGVFWSMLREPIRPGVCLRSLSLSDDDLEAKHAALDCHRSQTQPLVAEQPVLGPVELAITRSPAELYVVTNAQ